MSDVKLNPYLNFRNRTAEAMEFYQSVLGGELTMQRFKDMPMEMPKEKDELVMHAVLESGSITLMASDGQPNADVVEGTNVSLSLSGTDGEPLRKYFEGLSAGGTVTEPLMKAPWGDEFGMLTDKFGIHWLVNIVSAENAQK